jgi:hypothetical protein
MGAADTCVLDVDCLTSSSVCPSRNAGAVKAPRSELGLGLCPNVFDDVIFLVSLNQGDFRCHGRWLGQQGVHLALAFDLGKGNAALVGMPHERT